MERAPRSNCRAVYGKSRGHARLNYTVRAGRDKSGVASVCRAPSATRRITETLGKRRHRSCHSLSRAAASVRSLRRFKLQKGRFPRRRVNRRHDSQPADFAAQRTGSNRIRLRFAEIIFARSSCLVFIGTSGVRTVNIFMSNHPLVSICIPSYNHARFLPCRDRKRSGANLS